MRVLVLGGDGFCGWPTSLYLSDRGHDVTIIDNLSRRKIDVELEVDSLTPIRPIGERIRVWREVSGREIGFINLDLATEYDRLVAVLEDIRPDAIVHFAEQRAAPYSMRIDAHQALHGRQQRPGDAQPADRRWSPPASTPPSCTWARWASTATAGPAARRSPRAT